MSLQALRNALSGIEAAERRFGSTANNVANLRSEGYQPTRASAAEVATGGVRVTISREGAQAARNGTLGSGVNLVQEIAASVEAVQAYRANVAAAGAADDVSGATVSLGARAV